MMIQEKPLSLYQINHVLLGAFMTFPLMLMSFYAQDNNIMGVIACTCLMIISLFVIKKDKKK